MENLVKAHPPTFSYGVLGCSMYQNSSSIICCVANNDNEFTDCGIIDNSLVFVQKKLPFKEGALNVFKVRKNTGVAYKLSRVMVDSEYVGRALMSINQYEK